MKFDGAPIADRRLQLADGESAPQSAICNPQSAIPKLREGGTLAAFLVLVVALQGVGGWYGFEFGNHSDEPAHYVTGLLVRDYLRAPTSRPMEFAQDYYLHYPKVAFGHWPPLFYAVQGVWTAAFPATRPSLLVMQAVLEALLAYLLYRVARPRLGTTAALGAALLLVVAPLSREACGMLLAEVLVGLTFFAAAHAFGRYATSGSWRDALTFGLCASLALMTKGNGLMLALVPPLTLLLTGRWDLLRRPSFYAPAVLVGVLCGPWYVLTLRMAQNGLASGTFSASFSAQAIPYYTWEFVQLLGPGLTLVAAIGLVTRLRHASGPVEPWAAHAALLTGGLLFHFLMPCGLEERYLYGLLPSLALFTAAGVASLAEQLPIARGRPMLRGGLAFAAAAGLFAPWMGSLAGRENTGFAPVAERVLQELPARPTACLVSSDDIGEGMFIAAVAQRDVRPGQYVLRASKTFVVSRWDGSEPRVLLRTAEEIGAFLKSQPVHVVVVDTTIGPEAAKLRQHQELLRALEEHPEAWRLEGTYPRVVYGQRHEGALRVYRLIGRDAEPLRPVRVNMEDMLRRSIGGSEEHEGE